MNPAYKFLIFFGFLDLFYGYPLDFGPIIHPQFFFLYMRYFDSVFMIRKEKKLRWIMAFFPQTQWVHVNPLHPLFLQACFLIFCTPIELSKI